MVTISRRRKREVIPVDRRAAGFDLRIQPCPGGIDQEVIPAKIIRGTLSLSLIAALVQLEKLLRLSGKFLCRRFLQALLGKVFIPVPTGDQWHVRLLARGID